MLAFLRNKLLWTIIAAPIVVFAFYCLVLSQTFDAHADTWQHECFLKSLHFELAAQRRVLGRWPTKDEFGHANLPQLRDCDGDSFPQEDLSHMWDSLRIEQPHGPDGPIAFMPSAGKIKGEQAFYVLYADGVAERNTLAARHVSQK